MKKLGWLIPAATVAAVLVAGCGGGSGSAPAGATAVAGSPPSATALAQQVNAAMAKASSVHLSAHVLQGNTLAGLNMSLTRSGEISGQISVNKAPVTILATQGQTYIKLTAAALKAEGLPAAACSLMCGKYLKLPANQAKSMLSGISWSQFVGNTNTSPNWSYVKTVTVNGQPAWQMSIPGKGTAYIAAQGQPYPLRLTQGSNRADFTQWNSVTIPSPPPASQVVDLSQVLHF
jgi:hypothetical protein